MRKKIAEWIHVTLFGITRLIITGLLSAKTDEKVVTEVIQDGNNFTWTQSIPNWSWSNTFTVGQECELVTMTGAKFKVS